MAKCRSTVRMNIGVIADNFKFIRQVKAVVMFTFYLRELESKDERYLPQDAL